MGIGKDKVRRRSDLANTYARLRLKHLRLLEVLHRTGSMGQAAEELRVTQSAATKILQDAEQIFDSALFNRSPRGLSGTAVGLHVIQYAKRILNDTERVVHNVDNMKAGGAGSLAIGAIMAAMPGILPAALTELRSRKPLLTVHLTASTSDEIVAMMEQKKLDIAVCRLTHASQASMFDIEVLFSEASWLFVGRGHPLANSTEVQLADLVHLPWVMQPWSAPARQLLEAAFAKAGIPTPPSRIETTSRFATLNLVSHAGMVGLLPSTILAEPLARGDLVRLPIDLPDALPGFGLVTRRDEPCSEHALEFASIIRSRHGLSSVDTR